MSAQGRRIGTRDAVTTTEPGEIGRGLRREHCVGSPRQRDGATWREQ